MPKLKSSAVTLAAAVGVLLSGVPVARAVVLDSTDIAISVQNAGLSGFSGPFANLHIGQRRERHVGGGGAG